MTLYRIEVGSVDGVEVRNIVGAITNETGLRNRFIGQIRIHPEYSTIELPGDLPRDFFERVKRIYVGKKPMKISRARSDEQFPVEPKRDPDQKPKGVKPRKTKSSKGQKSKKAGGKTKAPKSRKPKGRS